VNFHDPQLEYDYENQPDHMLKYSILLAWWVYLSLIYVQIVDHPSFRANALHLIFFGLLSLMVFLVWYKTLCHWRYGSQPHDYSYFSCCLFFIYEEMQRNFIVRVCIYMTILIMNGTIIGIILVSL